MTQPLAANVDCRVWVSLDWIIVEDSPESWVRKADWDEYLLRARALGSHEVEIQEAVVYDSLDTALRPMDSRTELKAASRGTRIRYKDHGLAVRPGVETATMVGVATGATGASLATAGTVGGYAGLGIAAVTVFVAVPLAVTGLLLRANNESKVTEAIRSRPRYQCGVGGNASADRS